MAHEDLIKRLKDDSRSTFCYNGLASCRKEIAHLAAMIVCFVPIWAIMIIEPVFEYSSAHHQITSYIIVSGFFFIRKNLKETSDDWLLTATTAVLMLGYIGLIVLSPQWSIPLHEPVLWTVGVTLIFASSLLSVIPFSNITAKIIIALFVRSQATASIRAREAKCPSKVGGYYSLLAAVWLFAMFSSSHQFFSTLHGGFS